MICTELEPQGSFSHFPESGDFLNLVTDFPPTLGSKHPRVLFEAHAAKQSYVAENENNTGPHFSLRGDVRI